jgi:katanin p60 ATPase-containing subunit A1
MSSMMRHKADAESKQAAVSQAAERKRAVLVLAQRYLLDSGYVSSAAAIAQETNVTLDQLDVADNIDLQQIIQDYEEFHELKFGRRVKLVRKAAGDALAGPRGAGVNLPRMNSEPNSGAKGRSSSRKPSRPPRPPESSPPEETEASNANSGGGLGVQGTSAAKQPEKAPETPEFKDPMPIPLDAFQDQEMRELALAISRDILTRNPRVGWNDIVGLDGAKNLLQESVLLPLQYPEIFTGIRESWKGILLFGPPGTGKTLLAKAVATESACATFFNVSASTLVSKWRGDSEKLIRVLFELARQMTPSTIFLDEIDSIMGHRTDEHEASRRMKTEVLVQMDGIVGSGYQGRVFVLAASNLPWDLDVALLRRLEKRILVGLPEAHAREHFLRKTLSEVQCDNDVDYSALAEASEGFSGADLKLMCKEAAMCPVRRLLAAKPPSGTKEVPPVTAFDCLHALQSVRPAPVDRERYAQWQRDFGAI